MFACKIRNPRIGIWNPRSTDKGRNLPLHGMIHLSCWSYSYRCCRYFFFFRHKGNMSGTNMELAVPIFLFWTQNTSTLQQRCHWMSSMTYTGKVWNRHTHLWRKHKRARPKSHNAIKLYKRAKVHPTTITKHSSHKCCAVALCNSHSVNGKDWTFHVFPKNRCRRLFSPLSTAHVHLL